MTTMNQSCRVPMEEWVSHDNPFIILCLRMSCEWGWNWPCGRRLAPGCEPPGVQPWLPIQPSLDDRTRTPGHLSLDSPVQAWQNGGKVLGSGFWVLGESQRTVGFILTTPSVGPMPFSLTPNH